MTDKGDFLNNDAKEWSRTQNLLAAKRSRVLFSQTSQTLMYDWVGFGIGRECPTHSRVYPLLGPEARFVGVDHNPDYIAQAKCLPGQERSIWLQESFLEVLQDDHETMSRTGVLNLDTYNAAGGAPAEQLVVAASEVALGRYSQIGEFLLILNFCKPRYEPLEKIYKWVQEVTRKHLRGCHPIEPDRGIYTSKKLPMVNVHVGFGFDPYQDLEPVGGFGSPREHLPR